MNRTTANLRSVAAKERARSIKRGRTDDSGSVNGAAAKLRKSMNSTSTSSAIASSSPAVVIASGRQGRILPSSIPPGPSALFSAAVQSKGIRVKPSIRAKQTQLFGERVHGTQLLSTRKLAVTAIGGAASQQTTLTTRGGKVREALKQRESRQEEKQVKDRAEQQKDEMIIDSRGTESVVAFQATKKAAPIAQEKTASSAAVVNQPPNPIDIPATGTLLEADKSCGTMADDTKKAKPRAATRTHSSKIVSRNLTTCATAGGSLSTLTTATTTLSITSSSSTAFATIKAFDTGDHPCLDVSGTPPPTILKTVEEVMVDEDATPQDHMDKSITTAVILKSDRLLLQSNSSMNSLKSDSASYGHDWLLHHKRREMLFQPWQLTLAGKMDKLRLGVIAMYWQSAKLNRCSLATIYVAINNLGRLLASWTAADFEHPSHAKWALTAVTAYRLAFKMEERPDVLWEVSNFWDLFPMFADWTIDRSDENMNKIEMTALQILNDSMDVPQANMFLSFYLAAGGWPADIARDYQDLASYLIGVSTFASARDNLLKNAPPSKMAAAALVLAIKIINGDRSLPTGILPHLSRCQRVTQSDDFCSCRYEFFPKRLEIYSEYDLADLQPLIRGLSCLLRAKPEEALVLRHFFPLWGENDWQ